MIGMVQKIPRGIMFFLLFLLVLNFMIETVNANDDDDDDKGWEEGGNGLGVVALWLLGIGSLFVGLKRAYMLINSFDREKYSGLQSKTRSTYRKFRKPLLYLHSWVLGIATIIGGIHGLLLFNGFGQEGVLTGTIAFILMLLLTIFGSIAFFKFKPMWDDKRTKKFIRFIHRQWILSVLLVIFLIIHVE